MLHELLLSLLGKTGSIIKPYPSTFAVDPSATILTANQAKMINDIAQCGYYYSQLCRFVEQELVEISFADYNKNPSVYRKAIAQGLRTGLKQYEGLVLAMERDFLASRHFTFSNIKAQTNKYLLIMQQMHKIVDNITAKKYRGAVLIDIFWETHQTGPLWLRPWVQAILKECEKIFVNQVIGWIAHGQLIDVQGEFFIHKVVHQPQERLQFGGKDNRREEMSGWGIYTLDSELIPLSIVSHQTAAKILFIGKSVKILLRSGRISSIPSKQILVDLRGLFGQSYSKMQFESTIQKIRKAIAEQMIRLIIGEENLVRQLQKINDYYLMLKGQFYHHFLEEAQGISQISNREKVQKKINETWLPNTFIRIGQPQEAKRVNFEIKAMGFSYVGFKNFVNICPVGNIDLVQGKHISFSSSGGGIWHRTKQVVENNFSIVFSISFKRSDRMFRLKRDELKVPVSMVSLVIQNHRDIQPTMHENPSSLEKINEYVAVNVGYRYSHQQKNYQSLVYVTYKNQKKYAKQVQIGKLKPKTLNLMDGGVYFVKVAYSHDQLKIGVSSVNNYNKGEQNLTIDQIRLSSYLNLEMNRANVGILSNIQDFSCQAQIEQWEMICKPTNHHGDHWSDLALKLAIPWPLNLILTPDLMEIFSRIQKFLFPIRLTQIQLEKVWMRIPRRIKEARYQGMSQTELRELNTFQRRLSASRARMNMVVNNLWSYFEADVIDTAWSKLKQTLANSDDFEDVIRMLTKYVNTIQTMFYFNALKIQRHIHEIVRQSRNFLSFFSKLESENVIDSRTITQHEHLDDTFRKNVSDFNKLLKQLSKSSNSTHLFHLTQRIEGCVQMGAMYLYQ